MPNSHQKVPDLSKLAATGSTSRVINLNEISKRHGDKAGYRNAPLFQNTRLNEALIVKHTLRPHERELVLDNRVVVTKVIIPISRDNLRLGGYSFFCEQQHKQEALELVFSRNDAPENVERDLDVLNEISRMPSFAPYLLRERLRAFGVEADRVYFDISDSDLALIEKFVSTEIAQLVERAYDFKSIDSANISRKLAKIVLSNEDSEKLNPVRDALKLGNENYEQGMFGWKGILYYKWQYKNILRTAATLLTRMQDVKFVGTSTSDTRYLQHKLRHIITESKQRLSRTASHIERYNKSFQDFTLNNNVESFRGMILNAPDIFKVIGEDLSTVQHICSLWGFQQPRSKPNQIEAEDAFAILNEFSIALGEEL